MNRSQLETATECLQFCILFGSRLRHTLLLPASCASPRRQVRAEAKSVRPGGIPLSAAIQSTSRAHSPSAIRHSAYPTDSLRLPWPVFLERPPLSSDELGRLNTAYEHSMSIQFLLWFTRVMTYASSGFRSAAHPPSISMRTITGAELISDR
ncbi:hypothetical protein M422DRAFT_257227 [Sphaerobolus stellatus SS14]|uniref:Uncharacterized protein n=1 Tax=Sphaerobolus stellatus (strain SS14) TaxID=990650 RepID=A0A0C9UYI1_SPHS4|nr:hypothetical protein M422DRAFT_257227 [Sphaerobolus stellatus SS14]